MKTLVMTTAALLLSGTAAAAPAHWNGAYAGAHGTYAEGHSQDRSNPNASEKHLYGATGGLQAGRHWQLDNGVVLGVDGALSFGNIDRQWKDRQNHPHSPYYGKDAVTRSGTLNATLGYALGQWLPYVTTGVTIARQQYTLGCDKSLVEATNGCRVAEYETRASHTSTGANVGAGVLYRVNDRLSGGVEYRRTHLGSHPVSLADPNYPGAARRNFHTGYSSVTLKLNYHF